MTSNKVDIDKMGDAFKKVDEAWRIVQELSKVYTVDTDQIVLISLVNQAKELVKK